MVYILLVAVILLLLAVIYLLKSNVDLYKTNDISNSVTLKSLSDSVLNYNNEIHSIEGRLNLKISCVENIMNANIISSEEIVKKHFNAFEVRIQGIEDNNNESKISYKLIKKEIENLCSKVDLYNESCDEKYKTIEQLNIEQAKKLDELDDNISGIIKDETHSVQSYYEGLNASLKESNSLFISKFEDLRYDFNSMNKTACEHFVKIRNMYSDNTKSISIIEELFRLQMANLLIDDAEDALKIFKESQGDHYGNC